MNPDLYDFENMKKRFTEYLAEKKLRKTTERFMILKHICRIQGHFDVEMLHKQMDDDHFHVSKASIYNTIETLMDAHIVVRHQFSSQCVQYELQNVAATHHHAICSYCGAIIEIKENRLAREMAYYRIPKFTREYHSLYIYGMCSKCKFRMTHLKKRLKASQEMKIKTQHNKSR